MAGSTVRPNQPRSVPPRLRVGTHRSDPILRLARPSPASRVHVPEAACPVEVLIETPIIRRRSPPDVGIAILQNGREQCLGLRSFAFWMIEYQSTGLIKELRRLVLHAQLITHTLLDMRCNRKYCKVVKHDSLQYPMCKIVL